MRGIIIQGSSRSDGNTHKIVQLLNKQLNFDVLDLRKLTIGHYDYEYQNQDDDYKSLIRKIADEYDFLLYATPVYWYTMSGLMKIFFDRFSDCIRIEKETGRKLREKKMAVICCGSVPEETEGFFIPFKLSAKYLGMQYVGDLHTWIEDVLIDDDLKNKIHDFGDLIRVHFV